MKRRKSSPGLKVGCEWLQVLGQLGDHPFWQVGALLFDLCERHALVVDVVVVQKDDGLLELEGRQDLPQADRARDPHAQGTKVRV